MFPNDISVHKYLLLLELPKIIKFLVAKLYK